MISKYWFTTIKILALIIILGITSMVFIDSSWEVEHRIEIDASVPTVWGVLTQLELYPLWNRYSPNVRGKLQVGEVIWVEAHLDDEIHHVQNFVLSIKPEKELCWQSADKYGFLVRGTRCRRLESRDTKTLLIHHEIMRGPLAWYVELVYRDRIERGLSLVDASVAQRAEFLQPGDGASVPQ